LEEITLVGVAVGGGLYTSPSSPLLKVIKVKYPSLLEMMSVLPSLVHTQSVKLA